jgi:hypothetical protein
LADPGASADEGSISILKKKRGQGTKHSLIVKALLSDFAYTLAFLNRTLNFDWVWEL